MRQTKLVTFVLLVTANFLAAQLCVGATYKVLHTFSGGRDGGGLYAGVVRDGVGNLYGVTSGGGAYGDGTVFQLSSAGGGNWVENVLYDFCAEPECPNGGIPDDTLAIDGTGNLYGTASARGPNGVGSVFQLAPGPGSDWKFTLLADIGAPPLTVDTKGNVYGEIGPGKCNAGDVLKLKPPPPGGDWTSKVLYSFCLHNGEWSKGKSPNYGVSWDTAGNLYGVTNEGGKENQGVVFQLEHTPQGWKERVLHSFHLDGRDGVFPYGGVVVDSAGNVYGTTLQGGSTRCNGPGCGTIYKVSKQPDGHWKWTILFRFPKWSKSGHPLGTLAMDAAGNLYGVAGGSGNQCSCGVVFKFIHNPDDTWTYTILHRFKWTDGAYPQAGVILDTKGNIYGTTSLGGAGGYGVVFKIAP